MMWALLTSRLAGPIATGAAALLLIALATVWLTSRATISDLRGQRDALDRRINDPATGYVVTMERAQANAGQYRAASDTCNAKVTELEAEGARKAAEFEAENKRYRADAAAARRRAAAIIAAGQRLPGEDECSAAKRAAEEINQ